MSDDDDVERLVSCVVVNEMQQTMPAPLSVITFDDKDVILTRSLVEFNVRFSMVSRKADRTNSLEISDNSILYISTGYFAERNQFIECMIFCYVNVNRIFNQFIHIIGIDLLIFFYTQNL